MRKEQGNKKRILLQLLQNSPTFVSKQQKQILSHDTLFE